jgi:ABC-type dipeptide/oligopeptide/nickel transport system permease component
VLVAVPLGVIAAWRFGGWLDRALMGFSVLGFSVPVFVLAYLLIWLFSLKLGWLPVQGYKRLSEGVGPWLYHLVLPAITLSVIYIALIARVTRASVLDTLGEDYIRTARAKGLPEAKVLMRHALANAAVPIVTVIGIGIALLIGGVVVTESVYAIPGLGRLTVDAVLARDFPDHPGRDPAVQLRLRDDQPAGRPELRVLRPTDPLLMAAPSSSRRATVGRASRRRSIVHVGPRTWAARAAQRLGALGGGALLILVLVALAAPWLGTVDPSLFDPASRDLLPGKTGEITTLEGETLKHRFLMGSDSFGRDIYSRVIYGTRVSLIVGVATAVVALAFGVLLGLMAGFLRWLDGPLMRVMDGLMAIPAILIAIALVAMWRGSLRRWWSPSRSPRSRA